MVLSEESGKYKKSGVKNSKRKFGRMRADFEISSLNPYLFRSNPPPSLPSSLTSKSAHLVYILFLYVLFHFCRVGP